MLGDEYLSMVYHDVLKAWYAQCVYEYIYEYVYVYIYIYIHLGLLYICVVHIEKDSHTK